MTGRHTPLRLAMADWDYSWLLRTSGRGEDDYHLLPRRMEELAERGFNALRVDAWPHLIAPDGQGETQEQFDVLPSLGADAGRGLNRIVRISPQQKLLRLAQAAHQHGIQLWLTSWFLPDTRARRSAVRKPQDFVRVWHHTLELLAQYELLPVIAAVDFAHRFPEQPAAYGAWPRLFHRQPLGRWQQQRKWLPPTIERINDYLISVPSVLRTLYPDIRFGLSVRSAGQGQMKELNTSELDFLDLHLTSTTPWWQRNLPVSRWRKGRGADEIAQRVSQHQSFCRLHQLQPVLGEGFLRLEDEQNADWDRFCHSASEAVDAALASGIQAINPARYARPQSQLWENRQWLQGINHRILG